MLLKSASDILGNSTYNQCLVRVNTVRRIRPPANHHANRHDNKMAEKMANASVIWNVIMAGKVYYCGFHGRGWVRVVASSR